MYRMISGVRVKTVASLPPSYVHTVNVVSKVVGPVMIA